MVTVLLVIGVVAIAITSTLGMAVIVGSIYCIVSEMKYDDAKELHENKDAHHGYE